MCLLCHSTVPILPLHAAAAHRSRVNVCQPDFGNHPLFSGVGSLEVLLGPGDAVFFPSMWAHYTESLGDSKDAQHTPGTALPGVVDTLAGEGSGSGSFAGNGRVSGCSVSVTFRVAEAEQG